MAAKRYHIIIDLSNLPDETLTDQEGLLKFLTDLPPIINMHILFGPSVVHGIPENPGLSGFCIIDYSHISVHTFTQSKQALIDIFSCKPFEKNDAEAFCLDYFKGTRENADIKIVSWD